MTSNENIDTGARFWILDPLPEYINVWVFKTNRFVELDEYTSVQYPSGVTLRYLVSGRWEVKMLGNTWTASPGDIFCAVPSEPLVFSQLDKGQWEWLEIQFSGPYAEKFIGEFGLSPEHPVITPEHKEKAAELFMRLYQLMQKDYRTVPQALELLFGLLKACRGTHNQVDGERQNSNKLLAARVIDYLDSMPSAGKNVSELAEHFGVDRTTLGRAFRRHVGMTPHEYLDWFRLQRACELLKSTELTIAEVAKKSGFSDVKYFIGWFKKHNEVTPGNFRKAN